MGLYNLARIWKFEQLCAQALLVEVTRYRATLPGMLADLRYSTGTSYQEPG